jgi:hypothetical protein
MTREENALPATPLIPATDTPASEISLEEITEGLASIDLDMPEGDTSDVLSMLIAALTTANKNHSTHSRAIQWPEWDGTKDSYSLFKWTIESKIEQEKGCLGSNKAICTNIFTGLPKEKQQRVIHWLQEGGEDGSYIPEKFLEHMDSKFLDREEERKALDKLDRLRQGDKQKFEDFRQQFEQLSAQTGSLSHRGASKISIMRRALNNSLSRTLIPVELSNTDYDAYVTKVQAISTNLEAHADFRKQTGSTTHYYVNGSSHRSAVNKRSHSPPTNGTDTDGDVEMTDVNALSVQVAALVARLDAVNQKKEDKRPRAKWLPQVDFQALLQAGKCGRCKKPKHHPNVCEFRPAIPPKARIVAAATQPNDDDPQEDLSGSEN